MEKRFFDSHLLILLTQVQFYSDEVIISLNFSAVCGEKLDIHSGGEDLRFPHHQNEIHQSESCFDCDQWSNYWVHMGKWLFVG